jgi:hypothetical protein
LIHTCGRSWAEENANVAIVPTIRRLIALAIPEEDILMIKDI